MSQSPSCEKRIFRVVLGEQVSNIVLSKVCISRCAVSLRGFRSFALGCFITSLLYRISWRADAINSLTSSCSNSWFSMSWIWLRDCLTRGALDLKSWSIPFSISSNSKRNELLTSETSPSSTWRLCSYLCASYERLRNLLSSYWDSANLFKVYLSC